MNYPVTINNILSAINNELPTNGNQQITAAVLRGVLQPLVTGIYDALAAPSPSLLAQFPAYNAATTYTGGVEVVVKHNNELWLFVADDDNTGTTPGTNPTVWQPFSVLSLGHLQNTDNRLAQGQQNEVTAAQLRAHLDNDAIHAEGELTTFSTTVTAAEISAAVGFGNAHIVLPLAPEGYYRADLRLELSCLGGWGGDTQLSFFRDLAESAWFTADLSSAFWLQSPAINMQGHPSVVTDELIIYFEGAGPNVTGNDLLITGHYRLLPKPE